MRGAFKIGKIAGIEIGINYTWIIALVLFTWLFAESLMASVSGWTRSTYWFAGVIIALGVFISVLLHELSHSLVAIRRGMKVTSIILFIFGGVSNIEKEPESAGTEFIMAAAGPASSLVLSAIFFGIYRLAPGASNVATPLKAVFFYLFYTNLLLAIFNIIPGFPLDGGRVFRSIIWGATKSLHRATMIAGNVGRFFGWALMLLGIFFVFGYTIGNVGGLLNGIWSIFIGWFLASAADSAMREQSLQEHLAGKLVKDVMSTNPECISPVASVESVVNDAFMRRGLRSLPVCNESGLLGIITMGDVKKVAQEEWMNTPVQQVMTKAPLITVNENDDLNAALQQLSKNDLNQIAVMANGKFVGLLSRADVIRYLHTRQELGMSIKKTTPR
jgi:Zn-dependent protease/CBS domain-containing protein